MPEIKALLGGSACDLGGGLRAEWEPGAIQVTFPNGRARSPLPASGRALHFHVPCRDGGSSPASELEGDLEGNSPTEPSY